MFSAQYDSVEEAEQPRTIMATIVELRLDGTNMSREEFRAAFKEGFQRKIASLNYSWGPNIVNVLGEIAKNTYDHGNRKATYRLGVTSGVELSEAILEICDDGPGYQGSSPDTTWEGLLKHHFGNSSLPMKEDGNAGLGLSMIDAGLRGTRKVKGVREVEYVVTISPHFSYNIRIIFS